jgi:hypothetical protein
MSCSNFRLWVVSDDLEDRQRAEDHAATCPDCLEILEGQQRLQEQVSSWKESQEAPEGLEREIRARISKAIRQPAVEPALEAASQRPRRHTRLWIALAASFLLGIGLGVFQLPAQSSAPAETRRLLNAGSLEIARDEEAAQVRAITELEQQVAPILARVGDKHLAANRAARLMEYRSRIATLEVTIQDVRGFVEQNPGHPRARTMLLDAYKEKREVLREVIALEERSS